MRAKTGYYIDTTWGTHSLRNVLRDDRTWILMRVGHQRRSVGRTMKARRRVRIFSVVAIHAHLPPTPVLGSAANAIYQTVPRPAARLFGMLGRRRW